MAVKRTETQSYLALIKKFKMINANMDEGAEMIRQNIFNDLKEFTEGAQPQGKARVNWLARLGHPYGRGASASESTPYGRKRGSSKYKRGARAGKYKGQAPRLPIGNISGGLQRSKFVKKEKRISSYYITAGFDSSAKGALFAVMPGGTKKMVGRDLWGKGEKGALGKRVRMYRKAFRDQFIKWNFLP